MQSSSAVDTQGDWFVDYAKLTEAQRQIAFPKYPRVLLTKMTSAEIRSERNKVKTKKSSIKTQVININFI
jgi:hypothetical protein